MNIYGTNFVEEIQIMNDEYFIFTTGGKVIKVNQTFRGTKQLDY